ncbi:hypothetical protein [Luteimonas sp. MC1825]|uniref:hypothetical protein n=1 Tax=Luteimonas sp. MC1825 TaxID=2761107 RepID=UPI001612FB27|nr:hypothetical protein [Luteimonas sp. MC1825]MBB6599908.1 hypothetical protein [Luteimonas sp. MC1825]QOC87620.1 hypothetical protein IDM46_10250 [Luteimonas sp. MC1825]
MNPAFAQATPRQMQAGDDGYALLLETAGAPLQARLGHAVSLDVERLDRLGNWAFVLGTLRAAGGGRFDYQGTPFAAAAAQGGMSDVYVALLRREPDAGDADQAAAAAPAEAAARDQAGVEGADDGGFPPGGRWTVLDFAIGPGDVAWLGWPQEHAAPRALFGF